ncbi:hypothetical protein RHGRI_011671 [Rhododendron griersonianum]|uniref:Pentatricopeptide repeat-containing protein n=1 Tax=Rhododendron griersonianum TaxID=479676 RepID=A0AAV6KN77_9ERIC|nr:hypothetical protein RHGRI_011671 [Rhododendron griersonianum]
MAFSSCLLQFHPFTLPHTLSLPPLSLSSKSLKPIYTIPHRELLTSISASTSPSPSLTHKLPPDFSTEQLLHALSQQNDETSAVNLFRWASKQPNFKPTLPVYKEIIRKLGHLGSFDSMKRILKDMRVSNCRPDEGTFLIFIESYAKRDLYDDAIGVLDMMEHEFGLKPGRYTYNFLLNVLVDGNKLKLVASVHSMMFTRGVEPDVSTFNIVIKALCNSHQIRHAILMIEDLSNYGLEPDEITYTTIMQGYIEEGNLETAIRIWEEMIAAQCPLSKVTVNVLIHGYCKEGRIEEALKYAEEMWVEGFRPDQFTFNTLVHGLCKSGHVEHALELLDLMLQEGFDPDVVTYNTLISELCKSGQDDEAMEVLNQMISRDCSPDTVTYNTLLSNLCKEKQMEKAAEFAHIITKKGILLDMITEGLQPDKFTYDKMLSHFCRAGNMKKAADIVQTMASNGCELDHLTYGTLIQGFCKARKIKPATRLLRTMQLNGMALTPQIYNPLIEALFKEDIKEAMRLFREMEEKGHPPDAVSYKIVFRGLCSGGGPIGEAVDFLVEMTDNRLTPEFSTFCLLAKGLCVLSMEDTLVMLVERIMKADNFSENEVSVVMGLIKIRNFQDALGTLGRILNRRYPKRGY